MSAAPQFPPGYLPPPEDRPPQQPPELPPRRPALWKTLLRWAAGILGVLVIVIALGIVFLLHSSKFHAYVLRTAQQKGSTALGSQLQLRDYTLKFNGISPTLDAYGIVIHGAAPYENPPLLEIEHATVGVRIVSLLSRKWYLSDVELHRPIVRVFVDKNGNNNLPKPQQSSSKSNTSIFDLGVRHAVLDNGEVYYNDRKSVMNADLHELTLQAGYDAAATKYSGTLSYRDGHLLMENFSPIPHDMDAKFNLTPQRFTLESAELRSGSSKFDLSATADDYSSPDMKVAAKYNAVLNTGEFKHILKNPSLPSGTVNLDGSLDYNAQPNLPALQLVKLNGTLASNRLEVKTPNLATAITNIAATYSVANGNADVQDLRAGLLGGELHGTLTMRDLTGATTSHLKANLQGVQLAAAKSLMNSAALKQVDLRGAVNADADARWGKTMNNLVATADATLNGSMKPSDKPVPPVPLAGVVHAKYAAASKQITLNDSYLRLPQTSLTLNGTVSDRSALRVNLQSNDLHQLETIAEAFQPATPAANGAQPAQPLGLYGTASFNGTVTGSTAAPQIAGQLNAQNLRVHGTSWRVLRANLQASPSGASIQNGELDAAKQGRITFSGRTGLHKWAFTNTSPIDLAANISNMNAADLARAAGSEAVAAGTLSAHVQLHGTELNPVGQGNLSLTNAKISGETIQSVNADFRGTGDALHTNAQVRMPAGVANAVLTYFPKQRGYEAQITANGIRLDQLQTVKARNMALSGIANLNASGRGTIDDPQLTASLTIPQLHVQNQTISGTNLQLNAANHVANIALDSNVMGTPLRGRGTVQLSGDYQANATIDTPPIALAPLVAAYAPAQAGNITGQTELHATLRGPLKKQADLEAHATIPVLTVNYKNAVQLAAAQPIHLDYANHVLNLQRTTIRGTDTDLQLEARVPVGTNAPLSVLALGTVDLKLIQAFAPDMESSGQLRFNINSYGQRSDPNVHGTIEIVNAALATGTTPVGLQNGNGVLTLTNDRLEVTRLTANVGGGNVSAAGAVMYRPAVAFDLALRGNGIRMLVPPGVRTGLDVNTTLTGNMTAANLRGTINVDQLSFTPDFDLQELMGAAGGTASVPPGQGFSNNVALDLNVRTGNGINLVSKDLSLAGNANLNIRGTAAEPVVLGRVNLSNGDLLFRGNRYLLQGGTIDFVNPTRTQPVMNVNVNTTIQQYDIAMRFEGPIDRMRTSYTSNPALPPADIINLLAFGKTTEAAAANPNPPGNLGAESAIASAVAGQVTNRIQKIAGISYLSVDPTLGGNTQNPGATVTIQQRVTSKIFVTFSTDVTSTQREVIQLEYKKSPRVSFSGTRDQNGGFAFDTKIHKTW